MLLWIIKELPGMGIGFIAGAFVPGIGRLIKSFFVKQTQAGIGKIEKKL